MLDLVDTTEAARQLGVPPASIRDWKRRRLITPATYVRGRGPRGEQPLYRLDELRPLAAAYKPRSVTRGEKQHRSDS